MDCLQSFRKEYLTSNVHNVIHVVNEVERYGELDSFSAYPFENMLGKIKRLLRSGNHPMAQVAKRIVEGVKCNFAAKNSDMLWSKNRDLSSASSKVSKRNYRENLPLNMKL